MQLPALQSEKGFYNLIALDGGVQILTQLGLPPELPMADEAVKRILTAMQQLLVPSASGLVIDPIYSFHLATLKPPDLGVVYRLEKQTVEIDPLALPILIGNWGVGAVKQNYGAAKLELWYHPRETAALQKKQLVAEIYDYCQHEDIALLLKLVVYTPANESFSVSAFQAAQLEAAHEFAGSCSLMALQFPQDALACATLTAELDVPWVLVADDVEYDSFKDILRTAMDNGAKGYLVDEVLWREIYDLKMAEGEPDWEAMTKFLQTTARDRAIELARVVNEAEIDSE